MDFSSLNPLSSNPLNLAARNNDVQKVEKLLKKMNPNCVDNRGWTCLHEAAAQDSYDSLILILKHEDVRALTETHEGHTALYLACRFKSSLQTIRALLDRVPDIANYGSTENVTPLHVVSAQGRLDVIQLLIDYGAIIDVQDFDGDTPLHDASLSMMHEAVDLLLHVGADPQIRNEADYNPFHLASYKGCFQTVQNLYPFVTDINQVTVNGDTPLILATQGGNDDILLFLLKNGADPHIRNKYGELALVTALNNGHSSSFKILLSVTRPSEIDRNVILYACKPHFFQMAILESLLKHNHLGPEFFDFFEPFHVTLEKIGDFRPVYLTNAPINSYLNICEYIFNRSVEKFREFLYLFLMRGLSVNAIDVNECPPLVYLHYCMHAYVFEHMFKFFREHGCNVDYSSVMTNFNRKRYIPDASLASISSDPATLLVMLPHSLYCDPEYLLKFALVNRFLRRIPQCVVRDLLSMIDDNLSPPFEDGNAWVIAEALPCTVLSLKHLSRQSIRSSIRNTGNSWITTDQFYKILKQINVPLLLKNYLRFV